VLSSYTETVVPASEAEAIDAFADGRGVTVVAGGTVLMPDVTYGRYPRGGRTVMLHSAGLNGVSGEDPVTIGAMTRLADIQASGLQPLAAAAAAVADPEIRAQATIGGNLCAAPGVEAPRGDLQGPLLALGARVRSVGADGERTEPVEEFLAGSAHRLVLSLEVDRASRAGYVTQRRAHAHSYSVMAVAVAELDGRVNVTATGVGPRVVRLRAVEAALAGGSDPARAAGEAAGDIDPRDDALASAWYRREVLPVLITRALRQLNG
jgi:CO/xanthine dehydrogenase FAD-binding subunit